jgi:hypothetical protein
MAQEIIQPQTLVNLHPLDSVSSNQQALDRTSPQALARISPLDLDRLQASGLINSSLNSNLLFLAGNSLNNRQCLEEVLQLASAKTNLQVLASRLRRSVSKTLQEVCSISQQELAFLVVSPPSLAPVEVFLDNNSSLNKRQAVSSEMHSNHSKLNRHLEEEASSQTHRTRTTVSRVVDSSAIQVGRPSRHLFSVAKLNKTRHSQVADFLETQQPIILEEEACSETMLRNQEAHCLVELPQIKLPQAVSLATINQLSHQEDYLALARQIKIQVVDFSEPNQLKTLTLEVPCLQTTTINHKADYLEISQLAQQEVAFLEIHSLSRIKIREVVYLEQQLQVLGGRFLEETLSSLKIQEEAFLEEQLRHSRLEDFSVTLKQQTQVEDSLVTSQLRVACLVASPCNLKTKAHCLVQTRRQPNSRQVA